MNRLEQLLAEGYQTMADLNLSISYESFELETEASEKSERFFKCEDGE